jgi:signal transduction histidine kinase
VAVPLVVENRVWGTVGLSLAKGRPPLRADVVARLEAFTDLVVTGIANAGSRSEIERLAEEQAALRRVATLVARGAEPGEVFEVVAEEVGRVIAADVPVVVRYEQDDAATIVTRSGEAPWTSGSRWSLEGDSALARVFRTRGSARIDDYRAAPGQIAAAAKRAGGVSVVAAPIVIDDLLWGAALAISLSAPLPADAEQRLARFAELIATAISNAETRRALTASRARVVAAADETRRRLERDLHDGIQQRLVLLALQARTAANMKPPPSPEVQSELSLLADRLVATLEELREISRGIHPAVLSEGGLGPALKALARRSAVPVALDLHLGARPAPPVEAAAYYVASEAITNVVKHARASAIELRAAQQDDTLTLSIRDDGVGGAEPGGGSGIIGLNDRVDALGGTISVLSPAGEGTTVRVRLPARG